MPSVSGDKSSDFISDYKPARSPLPSSWPIVAQNISVQTLGEHCAHRRPQQARYIYQMLAYCWPIICDAGPKL